MHYRVNIPSRVPHTAGPKSTDPRCGSGGDLHHKDTSQYLTPVSWNDNLINNELGVKSELLDHRVVRMRPPSG
jgi:hypothetical protein